MKQPQELGVIPDQASADDAADGQSAGKKVCNVCRAPVIGRTRSWRCLEHRNMPAPQTYARVYGHRAAR